jgi:hypothetical protein
MSIESMKQALEALNLLMRDYGAVHSAGDLEMQPAFHQAHVAVEKLRQAIEQAEKQEPVACQHKRYFVDVKEQTGTCYDCGAEGRMRFVVNETAPVHASDISQERVDETVKRKHEFECPRCGHCCQQREWAVQEMVAENQRLGLYDAPKEWVSLTDEEIKEIIGPWGETPIKGYTRKLFDQIEAKLKEKNT